ncbi:hypothetical protein HDU86_003501 [Geranomyces michiganensis]|nr:hypothetical protein HDU86_003501 [Geranomyces michiganensis]
MNVLASFLQNELLALSNEAKRKNPEIKEAAERLLYILRALKERENVQIAEGVDPVASELAKTDEALKPFIMACETKNAKLIPIAVPCLQRLITHQAIPEGSIMLVLRTLSDLINTSMELQLKVLQIVIPLLSNYRNIHGEVLAEALLLCFRLQETKSPVVNNTAAATVRQMITFVFEKVASENDRLDAGATVPITDRPLSPSGQDAYMLFKDLCLLTSGEPAAFLSLQSLPKTFGLELLETVIAHHPRLFREHADLANLMKERVCPLIIKSFSERVDFPLACRLMRVVHAILKQHHDILVMECEIFLSMFCRHLEPDHAPLWHRVLVMEVYKSLCADAELLRFIYRSYDQKEHTTKIFHEMITAVRRIIVSENPALLLHPPHVTPAEAAETDYEEQHSLTASGAQMKLQCLDQLDKAEPPHIPDTYIIYLAIQCMNSTVESEAQFAMPLLTEASTPTDQQDDIILAIEMANASWAGILAAISFLVTSSVDDDVFAMVIRAYQSITSVVGLLGLTSHRDAFLASLSKSCLPSHIFSSDTSGGSQEKRDANPAAQLAMLQGISSRSGVILTDRNVLCLRALIYVAQCLTPILEDKAWYLILETLQVADKFISAGKTGRKEQSSMSLVGDLKDSRSRMGSVAAQATSAAAHMENQFVTLLVVTKKLFDGTVLMQDRNLLEFLRALCRLARTSTSGTALTPASGSSGTGKEGAVKITDEKSFAVSKLHDVVLMNVGRLIKSSDLTIWDFIITELVEMAHRPNCAPSVRAQLCQTISDVLLAAVQVADFSDPAIELKLLDPLRRLMLNDVGAAGAESPMGETDDRDKISKSVWFVDVQKSGLETINKIMQTSGQHLSAGWPLILEVIRTIGLSRVRRQCVDAKAGSEDAAGSAPSAVDVAATGTTKAPGLVRVAFPCLQLICTDFLSLLNPTVLHQCIEALGSFGAQTDDLNISLTAVGLLWSISDFVLTKRGELEEEKVDAVADTPNATQATRSSDSLAPPPIEHAIRSQDHLSTTISIKRSASACIAKLKEPLSKQTMDALWMLLLSHLSQLCSDPRPEVRNSANQTLFRTLGVNGGKLTLEAWEQCIWGVLFPLLERVQMSSDGGKLGSHLPASTEIMNSSTRNSPAKQWNETKVITLSGVSKCLFDFLPVLVDLGEGFDRAWALFLDYIKSWCLSGSPEVSMAAVKSLRTLAQYPKTVAGGEVAENVQRHLVKLMRVAWNVWAGIGAGIIAGADEHLLVADVTVEPTSTSAALPSIPPLPSSILHGFFTQDTLTIYVAVFSDIYATIKPTFGLFEIRQLQDILSNLLLYHTNPQPGATASRIRADYINDVDNLTALQLAVLDLLTVNNRLEVDAIPGAAEVTIATVARFIKLPFARRVAPVETVPPTRRASVAERPQPSSTPSSPAVPDKDRGFTYMALAKKSMQHLVEIFGRYSGIKAIYSSGTFEIVVEALGVPMRAKYQCPAPGVKDTTPLWRSAANTFMTIVEIGLGTLHNFVADLPQEVLTGIYMKVLDTLEGILLPSSEPPSTLSAEELSADEAFDISVLTTIESDIFPHLGQRHVPEPVLVRLVEMIGSGARRYTSRLESAGYGAGSNGSYENVAIGTPTAGDEVFGPSGSANGLNLSAGRLETLTKVRGSAEPGTSGTPRGPAPYPLGSDVTPVTRERFAVTCLETIFGLCSVAKPDESQTRFRIAEVVGPVMLAKCKQVIAAYINDKQSYGQLPLPRVRNEEIVLVMQHLQKLEMRPGVLVRYLGEDKLHPLRSHILAGTSAHLFALYPLLCDLIAVVPRGVAAGSSNIGSIHGSVTAVAAAGEGSDEAAVVQAVRACLKHAATIVAREPVLGRHPVPLTPTTTATTAAATGAVRFPRNAVLQVPQIRKELASLEAALEKARAGIRKEDRNLVDAQRLAIAEMRETAREEVQVLEGVELAKAEDEQVVLLHGAQQDLRRYQSLEHAAGADQTDAERVLAEEERKTAEMSRRASGLKPTSADVEAAENPILQITSELYRTSGHMPHRFNKPGS